MNDFSRREFIALSGATAAAASWPRQSYASVSRGAVFPYSTHIYREPPLPLEQIEADLPLLKKLGFTMIKVQESWSTDERVAGEINLSNVERIIAAARQHGLLVYFGVTMEQAPAWLWKKFPDASMVYEDGTPHNDPSQYLLSSDGKPGPCFHHADVRAAAEHFIEATGRKLGRYDNIAVWNVWQEIGLAPWTTRPSHRYLCYCANSLAAYRTWLKSRYSALEKVNDKWRTAFATWDEVEPPRMFTPLPAMIDWRVFMEDVYLADVLRWKAEAFRRGDPQKRPVMAHMPGSSSIIGSTATWGFARSVDIFGTSLYPGWGESEDLDVSSAERIKRSSKPFDELVYGVMLTMDYNRSASVDNNCWTAELQGGRAGGGPAPGRTPDAADIRRWVLGAIASGSRAICYWNHRNEILWSETSGFGLLDRTGTTTERAEEAGRLGRALQTEAELFTKSSLAPAEVGILVGERSYQLAANSNPAVIRDQQLATLRGHYRGLWSSGYAVDFIDMESPLDKLKHKVLILPQPLLVGDQVADQLVQFVKNGGTLISEATPGRFDDYGFGRAEEMAPGLPELFGVDHDRLMAWQTEGTHLPGDEPARWTLSGVGELGGREAQGSLYLQTLKVRAGTQVILKHGDFVVGTAKAHGKGRAILIGSLLGSAIAEASSEGNIAVLAALVAAAGAKPDTVGRLLRRRRVLGQKQAWLLINPTREIVRESVPTGTAKTVTHLLGGVSTIQNRQVSIEVAPLDIACLIVS